MKNLNIKNKNSGFTLVEMMVAIAVFSIVMVMAMGALLNVIESNNKAQSIKTAVDNISFALEGISKDMRMGTEYSCSKDGSNFNGDCSDGGMAISFKSSKSGNPYVYYKFLINDKSIGQILSCVSVGNTSGTDCDNPTGYLPLTSSEVNLTSVVFYVLGSDSSKAPIPNRTQPRAIIVVEGTAGSKAKTQTSFDLQTSISQISRIKI